MNKGIEIFKTALTQLGIGLNNTKDTEEMIIIQCAYRNNPDGSIRWIWPANSRKAEFLRFYYRSGLKSKLFAWSMNVLAKMRLLNLAAHGQFELKLNTKENTSLGECWSFFTGTIGPNRKAILWHKAEDGSSVFSKIPLSATSAKNLSVEASQLIKLSERKPECIVIPELVSNQNQVITLSDISAEAKATNKFSDLPLKPAQNWMQFQLSYQKYNSSPFSLQVEARLERLRSLNDERIPGYLIERLADIHTHQCSLPWFASAYAHGDLTPWNVYQAEEKLHLLDFELTGSNFPALYDLFHFVYQSNILVSRNGYKSIRKELDEIFEMPEWQRLVDELNLDVRRYEQCYLLHTISYYLEVYAGQPQWHIQVNWLLRTWTEALSFHLQNDKPARSLLLNDLTVLAAPLNYAVLKWTHAAPEQLPETSDLDICITKHDGEILVSELRQHILVSKIRVHNLSFMKAIQLLMVDGSVLYIDLVHQFKRRQYQFLDAKAVLASAQMRNGFRSSSPVYDALYSWLFYNLNNAALPWKYEILLERLTKEEKENFYQKLRQYYGVPPVITYDTPAVFPKIIRSLWSRIKSFKSNTGVEGLQNRVSYFFDTMRNLFPSRGFIITFSGVDGAGKSTVISEIKYSIEKKFRRKVKVLRHRPSLLPILSAVKHGKKKAEQNAALNLPRMGSNKSIISSLFRFGYYYFDYLLGQFYIRFKYVNRGYVVLYDRYYFDFINDAKRSNIHLPKFISKFGYRLLLKPELNFFLYAEPELIYKRKQELQPAVIRRLTGDYLELFNGLQKPGNNRQYVPIENNLLDETLSTIENHITMKAYEAVG